MIALVIIARTLLIVIAYGVPALRIRAALKLVSRSASTPLASRLLRDYLMLIVVGLIDVVALAIFLLLPAIVPESVRSLAWYEPLIVLLWFGSAANYLVAGRRLGRVLDD